MDLQKLTEKSQQSLAKAHEISTTQQHSEVQPLHLLWAFLEDREGPVFAILQRLKVPDTKLQGAVDQAMQKLPKVVGDTDRGISRDLQKVLEIAFEEARQRQD
ncbi:MAG: Clp protease N-terminal domain-containing protein, partial [Myxococcota bacterium]